jgi:hypothetical protein
MDKKILILFLLICSFSVRGQIYSDTFNWFPPDTTTGLFCLVQDTNLIVNHWGGVLADNVTDFVNSYDFSTTGTFTTGVLGSMLSQGGDNLVPDGDNDYVYRNDSGSELDVLTGDFTVQAWFKTPATVGQQILVNKRTQSPDDGWQLDTYHVGADSFRAFLIDNGSYMYAALPVSGSTLYYAAAKYDRSGNLVLNLYSASGLQTDTVDISGSVATSFNDAIAFTYGTYAPVKTLYEWTGGLLALKFTKSLRTDKQLIEDAFLAEGWESGAGNVGRTSWAFRQEVDAGTGVL